MTELYPYCTKCDNELTEEEREMNRKEVNLFYPICSECLKKNIQQLKELVTEIRLHEQKK